MRVAKGILMSLAALSFSASVGVGIYFGMAANAAKGVECITLSDGVDEVVSRCDLGIISPGESKYQVYDVTSSLNRDSACSIAFRKDESKLGYDYVRVMASFGDEALKERDFSSCFSSPLKFSVKLRENETKRLTVRYTLAQDIPGEIVGTSLDFRLVFRTNAFI